jgi:predicted CXXCH cytochrome family protein
MRSSLWIAGWLGAAVVLCGVRMAAPERSFASSGSVAAVADPDAVCAGCHREIYQRYEQTPMARASGPAIDGLLEGTFQHAASGVSYRVFERDGAGWMSYGRTAGHGNVELNGERELRFFIGSGHRGRTYLYDEGGLWFEAPINYYSKKGVWDMAPAYGASGTMPDGLPVDSNCLHCHATDVQAALPGARNRYADIPFRQGGVGCSACHGDGTEHVRQHGHGAIVNPAKLDPMRRDGVCLQCHLEGDVAVYRAGKSLASFRPGEDLAEYVTYFVKQGAEAGGARAASQFEALLRSRCKLASGDKLTCTKCHDPHGRPPEAQRVGYFRAKCLGCHTGERMATQHHPEQQDCAACHMPTVATSDISHEQLTDHDIRRTPSSGQVRQSDAGGSGYRLVPVGALKAGDRELGLAYSHTAEHGDREALQRARQLLLRAEASGTDDAELHTQLGLMEQISGQMAEAEKEYDLALLKDPQDNTALGNKAVLEASAGRSGEAIRLLQAAVKNDPSQVATSLNLAFMECVGGAKEDAKRVLANLQRFSPDDAALQSFLHTGMYAGQRCDLRTEAGAKR